MTYQTAPSAPAESQPALLLWGDCEFTGLNPAEGHKIIEIGALVTDLALHEVEAYTSFIKYDWAPTNALMDTNPWWKDRAQDRERMRVGMAAGKVAAEVDLDLSGLVQAHFQSSRPPLFGNSIRNDMRQIEEQLPHFAGQLHYRVVDVSSLKIIAQLYQGLGYEGKTHHHYALDDVRESVDEFRFLMTRLGITDFSDITRS